MTKKIFLGGDFEELVLKSSIFADKSLFIKEVVDDAAKVILITMPRRWGKSVNMDMLRRFLEIEPATKNNTPSCKLFEGGEVNVEGDIIGKKHLGKLQICNHPEYMKLRAQSPVIYVSFKDCKKGHYQAIENSIKNQLNNCFKKHSYLTLSTILEEEEKEEIKEYLVKKKSRDLTTEQVADGLRFLSEMLYKHSGKKVWVLIDEYDSPINHAFMSFKHEDEAEQVIALFRSVLESVLKDNEYLEKGVITGINRIAKANLFSGLNNAKEYNLTDTKIAQYYGVDEKELNNFLSHFGMQDKKEDIKKWYNGYKIKSIGANEYIDKYNIWSIVSYLNDPSNGLKPYWEESGNINFIIKLFKNNLIRGVFNDLLRSDSSEETGSACFKIKDALTSEDFLELKQLTKFSQKYKITQASIDLFFSYFFMCGYLTEDTSKEGFYKIPNKEIESVILSKMLDYYKDLYSIDPTYFHNVTEILNTIMCKEDIESGIFHELQLKFKELIDNMPPFSKNIKKRGNSNSDVHGNEEIIHSMLNYICLQIVDKSFFGTEIITPKRDGRADTVVLSSEKEKGMIIEVKYNGNASKALEQSKKYVSVFKNHKTVKKIICIGIDVSSDKKVSIAHDIIGL